MRLRISLGGYVRLSIGNTFFVVPKIRSKGRIYQLTKLVQSNKSTHHLLMTEYIARPFLLAVSVPMAMFTGWGTTVRYQ